MLNKKNWIFLLPDFGLVWAERILNQLSELAVDTVFVLCGIICR